MMRRFIARIIALFRADHDLAREMRTHLSMLEDEYRRRGMSADDAALAARRAMGSVALATDLHRDARSFGWIEDLRQDLKQTLRSLRKNPGFTAVAVLTLTLGIGANTAIFSVVNTVLLRRASYADPDRLVRLFVNRPASATASRKPERVQGTMSALEMAEVRSRSRTLADIGTMGFDLLAISGRDDGSRLRVMITSSSLFGMLGAGAALGRVLDARDVGPSAERAIVLSHGVWRRDFAGDAAIVGRTVTMETALGPRQRDVYRVVGVMPPEFEFPDTETSGWIGVRDSPTENRIRRAIVARLRPGSSLKAGGDEITNILRGLRHGDRGIDETTFEFEPQRDRQIADVTPALLVLSGAVGLVLLIACINVANLLLARSVGRQRELAVRAAIGAGRGRLLRQGLTETVVLALIGAASGVVLAYGAIGLLQTIGSTLARPDIRAGALIPRLDQIAIDQRVLGFTVATSLIAGVLLGLAPAWMYSRPSLWMLGSSDRVAGATPRQRRGDFFVIAEIGFAMVLLLGSGLLMRGFIRLATVEPGFDAGGLLTFQVGLPLERYRDPAQQRQFAEQLVERLNAAAGVHAAYARQLPMVGLQDTIQVRRRADAANIAGSDIRFVSRDYISVMRIPLKRGSAFSSSAASGRRELLINESVAARDFAGEDPIGQWLYVGRDTTPWRIVGVVGNVRQFGLDREAGPQVFADIRDWRDDLVPLFPLGPYYAIRTDLTSQAALSLVGERVRELDAASTVFNAASMERLVAETIARPRMYAVLVAIFAVIGMALAVIGVYGVVAYAVTRRTREIGVRVALGATRSSVLSLVLRQAMTLTIIGVVAGLLGGAALTRYLEGLLFGLTPLDPMTFVGMSLLFGIVVVAAVLVPARRAMSVSPVVALRTD